MPEYPDIELYLHALKPRIGGQPLQRVQVVSPLLVRSVAPPLDSAIGKPVLDLHRLGKRIVWTFERELFLVFHLMIAGRFRWKPAGAKVPGKVGLAAFNFPNGTLIFTEAGSRRQASLYAVQGHAALAEHDPGGLDVFEADARAFEERLRSENHTLKRALTDPRLFSGIGNAYSDEILLAAGLSPLQLTSRLTSAEAGRLHSVARETLASWRDRLIADTGDRFPEKVTAFREGMATHGRYGEPCPVCGTPIQRIKYATNEANYCPACQTGGKLLADRGLSRLLGRDWPKSLDELERLKAIRRADLPRSRS